jgi:hypothetical protein
MLVSAHEKHAPKLAAGPAIPAESAESCAVTQALWRFLAHEDVTLEALAGPLQDHARQSITADDKYVLAVIDWSKIDYKKHTAKTDVTQLTHKNDIGYELTTQLLVNCNNGQPIAPVQMLMKYAGGSLATAKIPGQNQHRLDQVLPLMNEAGKMNLRAKLVTVIDREADAVGYYRQWNKNNQLFLVRSKSNRLFNWFGKQVNSRQIITFLDESSAFQEAREITAKGKKSIQFVAETAVVLDRPALQNVHGAVTRTEGEPLALRLVISRIVDKASGKIIGEWQLLTNIAPSVPAATIALWYYYRWTIESYFKLMKSGGQELEHWQQQSAIAIFKRLLIASMAATAVWSLSASQTPEASELKKILVRLSGKARKPKRPPTKGVLMSGLLVLLQIYDFLAFMDYDLTKISQFKQNILENIPALAERLV